MPVKIYVRVTDDGRELPPKYTHESLAVLDIIGMLWLAYRDQPTHYAIAINLHRPSADKDFTSTRPCALPILRPR